MNDYRSPNYFAAWRRTFDLFGDATRMEYWSFVLVNLGIVLLLVLVLLASAPQQPTYAPEFSFSVVVYLALLIFVLATIIPGITVTIRRVRDATGSGWMTLLAFVPIIGGIIVLVITLLPTARR